jgi:hypothetical protein
MELNRGFEYILIEDLSDLEPLTRLAAYLCLRYKVQTRIDVTWMGQERPRGFFDLFRNIQIITNEDDFQGLVSMTLRVHPPLSDSAYAKEYGTFEIPDVSFEKLGELWLVEIIRIEMQHEQGWDANNTQETDFNHPLLKSLERLGLKIFTDEDTNDLLFRPTKRQITVDEIMKVFLREKPGAKSFPLEIWNNDEAST